MLSLKLASFYNHNWRIKSAQCRPPVVQSKNLTVDLLSLFVQTRAGIVHAACPANLQQRHGLIGRHAGHILAFVPDTSSLILSNMELTCRICW